MRVLILTVLGSVLVGLLAGDFLRTNTNTGAHNDLELQSRYKSLSEENDDLSGRLNHERKWRAIAESQLLRRDDHDLVADAPVAALAVNTPARPPEIRLPKIGPRSYLEKRIEDEEKDPVWQSAVVRGLTNALTSHPGSEVVDARCSSQLCRVNFVIQNADEDISAVASSMGNIEEIQGERMIEIDDSEYPAIGIAYFSRDGAISLLPDNVAFQ
jgi:hypothetical protein